ncbi:DUF2382 domain-containing protein [Rubrobacter tropicus]|uniref:DUF2382 domain-containing protein n=1 Tax=Rubrobacter tropicus TaxID=2653851 RepID=UPI00140E1720|nr:DUF2382 domain-containing protein [Rubrobacter tropicus]
MINEERDERPPGDVPEGTTADERGGTEHEDLRVQRSEEELRAGVRQREAGSVNVKKSVHTEREEVRVPKRREQVDVERVQMDREVSGAEFEFGDEEVVVQVFEEEVVVTKRVVLKEEIRLRKRVVEEEEVVEVDLRKEEVEIDDQTTRGAR